MNRLKSFMSFLSAIFLPKLLLFFFFWGFCNIYGEDIHSEVVIRSPNQEEEFCVLKRTLIELQWLYTHGYQPRLPHHKDFEELYAALTSYPEKLQRHDERYFKTIFCTEIYDPSLYDTGLKILSADKGRIEQAIEKLQCLNKNWGFRLMPKYSILLTLYGVGGNYEPHTGLIHALTNPEGKFSFLGASPTVIHEIVHIGVEENIVQKYKLTHWEKEYVVDSICALYLKDLLPNYRYQKDCTWSKSDSTEQEPERFPKNLNHFIDEKAILNNLPLAISNFIKEFPR